MTVPTVKHLSQAEIRRRTVDFAYRWHHETQERGEAQSFWNELMQCFGVDRRVAGAKFDRAAKRASTGRVGFIDVFWPTVFLAEHKSEGKLRAPKTPGELSNAEQQGMDYLNGGDIAPIEYPRYLMTSDFASIQITDLEAATDSPARTVTFDTIDLPDKFQHLLFIVDAITTDHFTATRDEVLASQDAVKLMGALYEAILADKDADLDIDVRDEASEDAATQETSVLLTRLLFLMAGDDNGLWEHNLFARFVKHRTVADGSDLGAQIAALFDVLNTPEKRRSKHLDPELAAFPYVNGGVFGERLPVMFFNKAIRDALLKACDFDWSQINAAVFGALFQTVKSKEARRSDGEHYTSEANIARTLNPLFLDDLRARLARTNTTDGLRRLWDELGTFRYLDPACGCGNFLVIAYRDMRQLELDLIIKLRSINAAVTGIGASRTRSDQFVQVGLIGGGDLRVRLDQFHGIEINWWPAKIAETAMFLIDHQANRHMEKALGTAPQRLPINIAANIRHGNALTTPWEEVCPVSTGGRVWVFGNPPFAGHKEQSAEQSRELRQAWGRPVAHLDFVTAWYAHAANYAQHVTLSAGTDLEWAFVSTNSVAMGEGVPALFGPLFNGGWKVKFAHRTFAWSSQAPGQAAVHVVIIGFTKGDGARRLFDYPKVKAEPVETRVQQINAYLCDGPNVLVTPRSHPLNPQMGVIRAGSTPIDFGHLTKFTEDELAEAQRDPVVAKYLRPYVGGEELINGTKRWCLWMTDELLDRADLARSPFLAGRVARVKEARASRSRAETRALASCPYQFGEVRQPRWQTYLALPQTFSDNRDWMTVARLDQSVIPTIKLFTTEDPDGFLFAVASSAMFLTWQRTVGGRMKSDPSLSSSVVWNTFPLPHITDARRASIIAAGQKVVAARLEHPERSLAVQYQPLGMAASLVKAHDGLDAIMDKAMGASRRCASALERQRILFDRYAEATADLLQAAPSRKRFRRPSRSENPEVPIELAEAPTNA